MAHIRSWDETDPDDGDLASGLGDDVRTFKVDVRERMEIDHDWQSVDTGGEHKQITLQQSAGAPTFDTDYMFIYSKDTSGKPELFIMDEDGDEIQVTAGGVLNVLTGASLVTGSGTSNGYQKFENGLVLYWGYRNFVGASGGVTVVLTPVPTTLLGVASSSWIYSYPVHARPSGIDIVMDHGAAGPLDVYFIAVGVI